MTMRLMVLGVLFREKQAHGYHIYHELSSWQAETWTKVRPGSVYHALAQMSKEGLLANMGVEEGKKGSSKTTYMITPKGQNELWELVQKALVSYDQEEFTAGLAFMSVLTRDHTYKLALQRLHLHKQTVDFLQQLPQSDIPETPDKSSAIVSSWTTIFAATAKWQEQFARDIVNGKYAFSDD